MLSIKVKQCDEAQRAKRVNSTFRGCVLVVDLACVWSSVVPKFGPVMISHKKLRLLQAVKRILFLGPKILCHVFFFHHINNNVHRSWTRFPQVHQAQTV